MAYSIFHIYIFSRKPRLARFQTPLLDTAVRSKEEQSGWYNMECHIPKRNEAVNLIKKEAFQDGVKMSHVFDIGTNLRRGFQFDNG